MAKVFLTCFASLKPYYSDELAVGLFSSLSTDLQRLQNSVEENPPSLRWCSDAVSVIKKIHNHLLRYLEMTKLPSSWEGVEMLDEYMKASLDLLDLCNLLKLAVSGLDRYRMMVDLAINRFEDSGFSVEIKFERFEPGRSIGKLDEIEKWRETNNFSKKELLSKVKTNTVTKTIRSAMSVMSFLIVCLILNPTRTPPIKMIHLPPGLDSFTGSIQKLVDCVGKKVRSENDKGKLVLQESKKIEDEYASLKMNVEEKRVILERVESMRKSCVDLKESLELFESVTNELFEDVIKGRKRVIHFITKNNTEV